MSVLSRSRCHMSDRLVVKLQLRACRRFWKFWIFRFRIDLSHCACSYGSFLNLMNFFDLLEKLFWCARRHAGSGISWRHNLAFLSFERGFKLGQICKIIIIVRIVRDEVLKGSHKFTMFIPRLIINHFQILQNLGPRWKILQLYSIKGTLILYYFPFYNWNVFSAVSIVRRCCNCLMTASILATF